MEAAEIQKAKDNAGDWREEGFIRVYLGYKMRDLGLPVV